MRAHIKRHGGYWAVTFKGLDMIWTMPTVAGAWRSFLEYQDKLPKDMRIVYE